MAGGITVSLGLMVLSTTVDFTLGLLIHRSDDPRLRRKFVIASVLLNLGLLGYFKYFNFFLDSFVDTFSLLGGDLDSWSIKIILPVGISFYTFQTLSYSIDIYRRKIVPTTDLLAFAAFVSFFPQLVAGPIERAADLLPQMLRRRTFDYAAAVNGLRQILWGLFKKVAVADNCAIVVTDIFDHYGDYSGSTLLFGIVLFVAQIYCDFSGYSDIAIGTARLFGISLSRNFAYPQFSRSIAEFWTRWHLTLTNWFRDYLYRSLPGRKRDPVATTLRIIAVFLISGLWHGANWTFIVWGGLNGLLLVLPPLMGKRIEFTETIAPGRLLPSLSEFGAMVRVYLTGALLLVFFRSRTLTDALHYLGTIFSPSLFEPIDFATWSGRNLLAVPLFAFMIGVEWLARNDQFALERIGLRWPPAVRWSAYAMLLILTAALARQQTEFIYFQF